MGAVETEHEDVIYLNHFIWDKAKAETNRIKHHVSFEIAAMVFNDPLLLVEYDEKNSLENEDRYNCIGLVNGVLFLFVTMTDRDDLIRIISARKAESKEVQKYENNAKNI